MTARTDLESRVLAVIPELARRPHVHRAPNLWEIAAHVGADIPATVRALAALYNRGDIRVYRERRAIEVVERPALRLIRGAA